MRENYLFEYANEAEFKKLERSLKKYNMLAFKKLYFEIYPSLKEGKILGENTDENEAYKKYELKLPTDILFAKVHGYIKLHFSISTVKKVIILETITPESILTEGHQTELSTYKGVMVSKEHSEKDLFKINLLNMIQK